MINRVILLVIDGCGVGALPDAAECGDADANTLVHLAEAAGGLSLPNLEALGLGHIVPLRGVRIMAQPRGCFGRLGFTSQGKDSVAGYWETGGVIVREGGFRFASGIPPEVVAIVEQMLGRKVIGNRTASLGVMLQEQGEEHLSSGGPMLWTDGGRSCFLAMHESMMPQVEFQQRCREVWKTLKGVGGPIRIVAQPLSGVSGALQARGGRKDFVSEPPGVTMLDVLNRSSQITMGVGKIYDLFSGRGFTRAFPTVSAIAAFDETVGLMGKVPRGLLAVSLDLLAEDHAESATALQEFDRRLPDLFGKLRHGDLLVVTGDHGRDATRKDRTPTREYVPVMVTGPKLAEGVDLGTRTTAADLGQTVVEALRAERLQVGDSFLEALRPG
ncbi:MAG TPA: phosphopentomutase [Nitrospira sp.]|nr:phosphopentomutase [Nitrospira sp.]